LKPVFEALARVSRALFAGRDWLDVHAVEIPLPGLDPAFDGYRIAHFSDLHLDNLITTRARLEHVVEAASHAQPDLIAFTGDFVTNGVAFDPRDLIEPLRALRARDAVVAVMGNHDHRQNTDVIRRVIRESGMTDLNNDLITLRRGSASLHVAGVDSYSRRHARLDVVLRRLPAGGTAILLAHEPDFAEKSAPTGRFALQLSGHLHGGQIHLPLLTRLMLGANYRYVQSQLRFDDMQVYITRGIGMVGLPLRVNAPSEMSVLTLRAGSGQGMMPSSRASS
jgi:predicted MPP superfamily phosphohydrolase